MGAGFRGTRHGRHPTCGRTLRSLRPGVELTRKAKGDLAELRVAADLRRAATRSRFPMARSGNFDLILCREPEALERVQVKYTRSDGQVILVRPRSHSLTNGRVRMTKRYTAATIDGLAIWDRTLDRWYYIPASKLGDGMSLLSLRVVPTRNGQVRGIRLAER